MKKSYFFVFLFAYFHSLSCKNILFLADIEVGRKSMSINTLFKISNALHVSNDYLILGTKDSSIKNENLFALLDSLSDKELEIAEKMITLYIQGLSLKND